MAGTAFFALPQQVGHVQCTGTHAVADQENNIFGFCPLAVRLVQVEGLPRRPDGGADGGGGAGSKKVSTFHCVFRWF